MQKARTIIVKVPQALWKKAEKRIRESHTTITSYITDLIRHDTKSSVRDK
jgi:hypothetical protein